MDEQLFDDEEQKIGAVAHRAGDEDGAVHVSKLIRDLGIDDAVAQAIDRANEHFGNYDHDQGDRQGRPKTNKSMWESFEEDDVFEDAQRTRAHRTRGKDSGLSSVHHAIGNVEHDHEPGGERSDGYLGKVPNRSRNSGNIAVAGVD